VVIVVFVVHLVIYYIQRVICCVKHCKLQRVLYKCCCIVDILRVSMLCKHC